MATLETTSAAARIGDTAGQVWQQLNQEGPMKITHLVKRTDAPRDRVMQAIGWLAREEKIRIEEQSRSRVISLV